jgi:SOS-response transcriptional repressor LexA
MLRGIKGTYVYACDPDLREYLSQFIPSANKTVESSIKRLPLDDVKPFKNAIPLYNLSAAAGAFSDVQQVEDLDWISLPEDIKQSKNLFATKVVGESMNRIIPNGSICLFRKYEGGSRNGQIVLVEHTDLQDPDTKGAYTIKEYRSRKNQKGDQWKHESITLYPMSTDNKYEPIQLSEDEVSGLKVIGVFERVLGNSI